MGTKNNPSRYDAMAKAEPDEPYFVLLGRDRDAARLVREWAILRGRENEPGEVIAEALGIADQMDQFAMAYHARPAPPVIPEDQE